MADNDIASGLRDKYFGRGKSKKAAPSGPEFRAREEKFPLLGATGRALKSVDEFARKPFGYSNPPAEIISDLMQIPALTRTIENINYGSPLTRGTGQARRMTEDTRGALEGALNLAPAAGPLVRATKNLPVGMTIKPKNAQTITEHLERELGSLKQRPNVEANQIRRTEIERRLAQDRPDPEMRAALETVLRSMNNDAALDKWVDTTLRKYVIRDMGTPDDPLVKLADEGITHSPYLREVAARGEVGEAVTPYLAKQRAALGLPREGTATTPLGQAVEAQTDFAAGTPFKRFSVWNPSRDRIEGKLPEWTEKLDPETNLYAPSPAGLEFQHMLDVLAEDLATGRIRPDQLSKVSMEQAVRRAYQYDIDKAAETERAAVEEIGKHFPMHREYESGFKWVNLRAKPAATPDELTPNARSKYDQYMKANVGEDVALERANDYHVEELTEKALKNEGEIMGHCVGSYCEDVLSGVTDIYSLRDPKGRSHVTVEVAHRTADDYYDAAETALRMERGDAEIPSEDIYQRAEEIAKAQTAGGKIEQIKGKQNVAPVEEYQPYVADFVRSGQYAPEIGDFNYTDMVRIGDKLIRRPEFEQIMQEQQYGRSSDPATTLDWMKRASRMDPNTLMEVDQQMLEAIRNFEPPGMAEGGSVDLRTRYFGPARQRSSEDAYRDMIGQASLDFSSLLAGMLPPVNDAYERPTLAEFSPTQFEMLQPIEMIQ